jgi:hypothetical protein
VWCAVLDDQLVGPFMFEGPLVGEMYLRIIQEKLLQLLEDVPLNKRGRMNFQLDGTRIFRIKFGISLKILFLGDGSGVCIPTIGQVLFYFVWGWMEAVVYSSKVGTLDALLGCILDEVFRRNSGNCNSNVH